MVLALAEPLPAPPLAADAVIPCLQSSHCCGPWGVERVEINEVFPPFRNSCHQAPLGQRSELRCDYLLTLPSLHPLSYTHLSWAVLSTGPLENKVTLLADTWICLGVGMCG